MILLQEANDASTPEDFQKMIEDAGLSLVLVHNLKPGEMSHYYMGMVRRTDTPPSWLVKGGN